MQIEIIDYASSYFSDVQRMLQKEYDSQISQEILEKHYVNSNRGIILAMDKDINMAIGCAFWEKQCDYVRPTSLFFVTYVVVNPNYRKQGIGNQMFEFLIKKAQACQCTAIELTSANYRKSAHAFYKAIGFSPKKTTVFIKEIPER